MTKVISFSLPCTIQSRSNGSSTVYCCVNVSPRRFVDDKRDGGLTGMDLGCVFLFKVCLPVGIGYRVQKALVDIVFSAITVHASSYRCDYHEPMNLQQL